MIVFDTETTGLLAPEPANLNVQPHIIEFVAVKLDSKRNIIDQFETLVKPPIALPPEITKITGIRDSDLKNAPKFLQVWENIAEFCFGERVWCGHNVMFDVNMLVNELRRIEKQWNFPYPQAFACTIEMSMHIKKKRLKLADLYKLAAGQEIQGAHRAMNDVLATVKVYRWLYKRGDVSKRVKRLERLR